MLDVSSLGNLSSLIDFSLSLKEKDNVEFLSYSVSAD